MADLATRPDLGFEPSDPSPASGVRADRLDDALARMCGRLAVAVDAIGGDASSVGFLRGQAEAGLSGALDLGRGGCLGLPTLGVVEPIDRLVGELALTPVECDLLLLATMAHHHEGVAAILRDLHPEGSPWPTVGLAATLGELGLLGSGSRVVRPRLREILGNGPLTRCGVIELGGAGPFAERSLRIAPAVFDAIAGIDTWPEGVRADVRPTPSWGLADWLADPAVLAAGAAVAARASVVVLASTDEPAALVGRLAALVTESDRTPVLLHCDALDERAARGIALVAVARELVPVVWTPVPVVGPLNLADLDVPLLIAAPTTQLQAWPRPVLAVPTSPHTRSDRLDAMRHAAPELGADSTPVGPATIEPSDLVVASADLRARAQLARTGVSRAELAAIVDVRTSSSVPAGGVLVHPTAGWDDLVLPEARRAQLVEAVSRARTQSIVFDRWGFLPGRPGRSGLRLLFCGPPGTGKTFAAEVIAGELGRDLLVIDLSQLVSKWIGETEKNLAAAFDAAERGGAVIFFDEADSLFSKRTEVGDARDRYANLETAYLLSRLERFDGVAVLATNLRQNLDAAFARRIEFIVPFDVPDRVEREQLWRHHLPATAPITASLDLERLAALYEVPGALIRNAAVAAAFMAAAEEKAEPVIGMRHIVNALRREYVKAGQAFPGAPSGMSP